MQDRVTTGRGWQMLVTGPSMTGDEERKASQRTSSPCDMNQNAAPAAVFPLFGRHIAVPTRLLTRDKG